MKIKTLLVILAFFACLIAVVAIKQSVAETYKLHHLDFYEKAEDWTAFAIKNMRLQDDGKLLIENTVQPGLIQSPPIKTLYNFDEILLSWNYFTNYPGGLYIVLSLSPDSLAWYDFGYQIWGAINPDSAGFSAFAKRFDGIGRVDEDIIRLKQPMRYYKYAITTYADSGNFGELDRITVCYTNTEAKIREYNKYAPAISQIEPVKLSVPFKAQGWLPDSIAGLTCSPTSLTMVLNYYNFDYTHLQVASVTYDHYNNIYGNWPYNAQAAFILTKYKTWIGRHNSFAELAEELKAGRPVIISIAVNENQKLTGAPYKTTNGHLIVVRGFTDDNKVLINDPAGDNIDEGVVAYDIDELTEVWTSHEGVAYHICPQ